MKYCSRASEVLPVITPEGAKRRVLCYGSKLMLVQFDFPAGVTATWHNHPHEQVGYIVSGEIDFNLDGQAPLHLGPGDSYYVPPNAWHNVVTHSPSVLIDAFSPVREDFLAS